MKFLDLFAGIGGFRLGLEQAGHECVGFCEIDKFARQSYKAIHNTEGEREYHDITTVSNEEWRTLRGTVELICGGFPCQAFSIAGKRKGFLDETRGTLFFEIARAAEQIKPRTLFLENVRGLLSHDKGRTFRTIISTLNELGYDAEWQILNSKNFGVPQNRERVFIIGHLRGERGREVFPITRENSGAIKRIVNGRESHGHSTYDVFGIDGISPTLKTMQGGNLQPKIIVNVNPSGNGINGNVYDSERLAPTLTTNKGEGPKIAIPVLTPDRVEKRQNGRRFKEDGDPMFTLTAQDRHGVAVQNPLKGKTKNGWHFEQNVFDVEGLARTLKAGGGSGNIPKIVQKPRGFNKGGEHEVAPTLSSNSWHENNLLKLGGLYTNASENHQRGVLPGLSRTLKSQNHDAGIFDGIRIRKLTPRECWRLQGFPDWAFDKATFGHVIPSILKARLVRRTMTQKEWKLYQRITRHQQMSNSQLYKQAGNSVTVPVIYEIARRFE
ncbi:DNA (cytosine-5-)-methyltransferase [Lactococcus cremoris]|uniref:DNA (cytosine-5-)-methyltransferase n=1 Tax=Lactococcus lactis subsp. cremoris TaxID=1359 RepID=UPI000EE5B4A2|nr:DNA (cytosine-5-)-methyltransferase [Lactococcus cremoris]MCT0501514.1 DNA cytosine methyltransferase [Lactococcus cremoris]HAI27469.1 DNA (cytosine-5-)-methyltransferase [Lactococcus lactis]